MEFVCIVVSHSDTVRFDLFTFGISVASMILQIFVDGFWKTSLIMLMLRSLRFLRFFRYFEFFERYVIVLPSLC